MQDIIDLQKKEFGKEFEKLREELEFNKSTLALLLNLSDSTIKNIEIGKGFSSNTIYLIAYFFNFSASTLLDLKNISYDLQKIKNSILTKSKFHFPENYTKHITKELQKETLLTNRLIEMITTTSFFEKPKVVKDIKAFLKKEYNEEYLSSIISKRMSHMKKEKLIKSKAVNESKDEYYK